MEATILQLIATALKALGDVFGDDIIAAFTGGQTLEEAKKAAEDAIAAVKINAGPTGRWAAQDAEQDARVKAQGE